MELNLTHEKSTPLINSPINFYEVVLDCINILSQDCEAYLALVKAEQSTLASGQLSHICEKFILFIEIIREIANDKEHNTAPLLFTKIDLQNFLSLFKGLQNAVRAKDVKMIADLIEYELKDNLKRWKISLIQKALKA